MIKTETVCICDACGFHAQAKAVGSWRNETSYTAPEGWRVGRNSNVHFCPSCVKKLSFQTGGDDDAR